MIGSKIFNLSIASASSELLFSLGLFTPLAGNQYLSAAKLFKKSKKIKSRRKIFKKKLFKINLYRLECP